MNLLLENTTIMINIICLLTVTVMAQLDEKVSIPWMVQTQVHGHIIQSNDEMYVVDFSKEAKEKEYVGDYKERMVAKAMCVVLK